MQLTPECTSVFTGRHAPWFITFRKPLSGPPIGPLARSRRIWDCRLSSSDATSKSNFQTPASGAATSVIYSDNQSHDLPDRVSKLTSWSVTQSNAGLSRSFTFPSFAAAWRFMSVVADECKAKRHHPSWHNLYNQVTIEWTTNKPKGVSIKDVEMAEFCDRAANQIGLKVKTQLVGTASSEDERLAGSSVP